jgi:hypothetical protein
VVSGELGYVQLGDRADWLWAEPGVRWLVQADVSDCQVRTGICAGRIRPCLVFGIITLPSNGCCWVGPEHLLRWRGS